MRKAIACCMGILGLTLAMPAIANPSPAPSPDPVALLRALRGPGLGVRGIWVRPYLSDATEHQVDVVLDRARALGATEIDLETLWGGETIYPSHYFPSRYPLTDLLAIYARAARKRHMKIYAWIHTMDFGPAFARLHPNALVRDGFGDLSSATEPGSHCVDPVDPEVRRRLTGVCHELAVSGLVAGIQLDYLRYPVRFKGDDIDSTPDPRNFWGYNPWQEAAFFGAHPRHDTPAFRTFLQTGHAPDGRDASYLAAWKAGLAGQIEGLIASLREAVGGKVQLGCSYFPNYYFHANDTRLQESKRWAHLFDRLSPMCYSYFLSRRPGRFGDFTIDRELSEVEAAVDGLPEGHRPIVVATLIQDPPGGNDGKAPPLRVALHHPTFATQVAFLRARQAAGAYPDLRGVSLFAYGWLFPHSEDLRKHLDSRRSRFHRSSPLP